jgi:hypothetical protein
MIKAVKIIILVAALGSCNSKKDSIKVSTPSNAQTVENIPTSKTREEYWPLETEITSSDTTINSEDSYRIKIETISLNDSAAIHRATDKQGEIIIHTHNRVSSITILKNGNPFVKSTLTRDLFKGRDDLDELVLNNDTNFLRLVNNEFFFQVGACVPDSDVCDAAEVVINSKGQVRVVKYIEELQE